MSAKIVRHSKEPCIQGNSKKKNYYMYLYVNIIHNIFQKPFAMEKLLQHVFTHLYDETGVLFI